MIEAVETVIVGGGQAGLALSYHLRRLGREHVVLERGRLAERWRSERWDSLAFQFFLGLPWLWKLKSSVLCGVGEDAEHIAEHIEAARWRPTALE